MKKYLLSLLLVLLSVSVMAQSTDPVLMTINGKEIKKSEFDYIYNKNNAEGVIDKKSLEEYLELFKNFKLKVTEAESMGLDTTAAFQKELNNYRSQIVKTYTVDLDKDEAYVKRQYDRTKEIVEIAHILLAYPGDNPFSPKKQIFPADTLTLYNKAQQAYHRLKKKEDFSKLVKELSDDKKSAEQDIPGYIGSFPGMTLNPILEDAAFTTKVGAFSQPVRTTFGYHIVKVLSRIPNPGTISASHILIRCDKEASKAVVDSATAIINAIYDRVVAGEDFATLAKEYSDDKASGARGGELGTFGYGAMVKEFQTEAFALQNIGDFSKPFRSPFGFHIVKLLNREGMPSFEEKSAEIEKMLASGGLYDKLYAPGIAKMKQENGYKPEKAAYAKLEEKAQTVFPNDVLFQNSFEEDRSTLFTVGESDCPISDFIRDLKTNRQVATNLSTEYLSVVYDAFVLDKLKKAEDASLEDKHPEFKNLMKEYRDGILMFEISNNEVWNKASADTLGLQSFFEKHKAKYAWTESHFKGYVVQVKDKDIKKKIQKEVAKMSDEKAVAYLMENYRDGDATLVKIEKGLFKQGDNAFVDEEIFKSGKAERPEDFQDFFLLGKKLNAPESYKDVRGLVITDYQDYLEEEWLKYLNKKYDVKLFPEVLK